VLVERGLGTAIEALALDTIPVTLDIDLDGHLRQAGPAA
jgi:hypothetical protein